MAKVYNCRGCAISVFLDDGLWAYTIQRPEELPIDLPRLTTWWAASKREAGMGAKDAVDWAINQAVARRERELEVLKSL